MSEYLIIEKPIEITDFLITLFLSFSDKIAVRFKEDLGKPSYFERIRSFLNSNVEFNEVKVPAVWIELKAALKQDPTFKEQLQGKARHLAERLVKQAQDYVADAVQFIRNQRAHPDRKVVFIVDSLDRLCGVGDSSDVQKVFDSVETLFVSHAHHLSFGSLDIIYTVPPTSRSAHVDQASNSTQCSAANEIATVAPSSNIS